MNPPGSGLNSHATLPTPPGLLTAVAKAKATDKMLKVVDESLRRAAEMREERERIEAERREQEERDSRVERFKKEEEESARRAADRTERVAEDIAAREAARAAAVKALSEGGTSPLNVLI